YEMCTGKLPFDHEYEAAVIYSILDKSPLPPTELNEGLPDELEHIIYRCLRKEKADRYQSAALVLKDLSKLKGVFEGKSVPDRKKEPDRKREAERRTVTMLHAEISAYDEMLAGMVHEELASIMNRCFEIFGSAIKKHQGTIYRTGSSDIIALFGIPEAHENSPKHAINAAIEMRNRVHRLSEDENLQALLSTRIGINTGTVIADSLMIDEKREYTLLGDPVKRVSQLKDHAEAGKILTGSLTHRQTRSDFDFKPLKAVTLKGQNKSFPVYELLSTEEQIYRPAISQERSVYSEMVGRDKELDKLQYHLVKLINGEGSIVNIIGEAGLGKSRLMAELRKKDEIRRVTLIEGRAISIGRNLSFHPIIDIVKRFAEINEADSESEALQKLENMVHHIDSQSEAELLPFIATLLGMNLSGAYAERIKGIQGEALEKLILKNFRELLHKAAEQKPLVFVIEDLHWADLSSIGLLESIFRLAEKSRILFINVFRPNYAETGDRIRETIKNRYSQLYTEITLEVLNEEQTEELLLNLLKIKSFPPKLASTIKSRVEGNPFFIEELVRYFIDEGIVKISDGKFQVSRKVESVVIPETIHGVLMTRIDKLDEEIRSIVKLASVIGRNFFHRIMAEVASGTGGLNEKLSYLKEIQLIMEHRRMEELEYLFKHALVQQTTYETILVNQRKTMHLNVARAFETVFSGRLQDFYDILAYHFSQAEELDRAEHYLILAGERALSSSASIEALHYYKEALAIYKEKYGASADPEKTAMLEKYIAIAYYNMGRFIDAAPYFDRVLSYHGMGMPKHPVNKFLWAITGFAVIIFKAHFTAFIGKTTPTEHEVEMYDLISKKCISFGITDARRAVLDTLSHAPWYTRFNFKEFDLLLTAGIIFSMGGISFSINRRILDYCSKRIDRKDINARVNFYYNRVVHNLMCGNWQDESYDEELFSKGLETGDMWELVTYIAFQAHICFERGDRGALKMLDDLSEASETYENDYGRFVTFTHAALYQLKFRNLPESIAQSNAGIKFVLENLGNKPGSLMMYSIKVRAQVLLGKINDASETLQIAEELVSMDQFLPYFISWYLSSQLLFQLYHLEDSLKHKSKREYKEYRKKALNAGKKAVKICKWVAYERVEVYRLMGTLYWLTGKQKKALKWWKRSIGEAEKLGARLELSRTYFEVGKRLGEPGSRYREMNGKSAESHLELAGLMFEEMDLEWDLMQLHRVVDK
ncbi:MAG: AAA family ATPase, partial [Bacteroidota bacterium]